MSNAEGIDRAIAAGLRQTYREILYILPAWNHAESLVTMFIDNATMADDYTLCELESTYHASRTIEPTVYSDWSTVSETIWRKAGGYGVEYTTSDLFWQGQSFPNDLSSYIVDDDSVVVLTVNGSTSRFYPTGV